MKKIVILFLFIIMLCGCNISNHNWKNIAHRGQHSNVPENTLPAVMDAVKDLSHGIEIDIRSTRDGVIVLSHDGILKGTIDGQEVEYKISKTPYKVLKQVVLGNSKKYGEIHIATLYEVMAYASNNNVELILHCKTQKEDFLRKVAMTVMEYDMSGKCMYNVVNNFDVNIPIILSIDKKATFHIPYSYDLNSKTYSHYDLISDKQIAITVHMDIVDDEVTNKVRNTNYTYYIYGVDDENYKTALLAKPDYIEYSDKVRIANLDRNLFKKIFKINTNTN